MELIKKIEQENAIKVEHPDFGSGDTIVVHYKIKEGNKERIQLFQGVVIQQKGASTSKTFTVRKISNGIGVERIFPYYSTSIEKIELKRRGKVRRAKIFYMRERAGKAARVKEKRI